MFVGVEYVVVLSYYYNISLKEPVGLMARQEHLKGIIRDTDGIAFGDFSWVTEFGVVRVCHFPETKEGEEAGEELCEEQLVIVVRGICQCVDSCFQVVQC